MVHSAAYYLRLIGLSDSALPVGGFSFSLGVETAVGEGLIATPEELREYLLALTRATASLEGVAALGAYRASQTGDFERLSEVDALLYEQRLGDENRQMSRRMGHKLAELGAGLFPEGELLQRWWHAIGRKEVEGGHATTLGLLFATAGPGEAALFASLLYGVASQLLSAALRTMRISHHTTWQLLIGLADEVERLYGELCNLEPEQMHLFSPEAEILAALHERGQRRLFMN